MADWKQTFRNIKDTLKEYAPNALDVGAGLAGGAAGWFLPDLLWDKPNLVQRGSMAGLLGLIAIAGGRYAADSINKGRAKTPTATAAGLVQGGKKGFIDSLPFVSDTEKQDPNRSAAWGYSLGRFLNPVGDIPTSLTGAGIGYLGSQGTQALLNVKYPQWQQALKNSKGWNTPFLRDPVTGKLRLALQLKDRSGKWSIKNRAAGSKYQVRPKPWTQLLPRKQQPFKLISKKHAVNALLGAILTKGLSQTLASTPYSGRQE